MCNNFVNISFIYFVFCVNAFVYLIEDGMAAAVVRARAGQTTEVAQTDVDIFIKNKKMSNNFVNICLFILYFV